jgi:TusA-related sulfurtransferase
MTDDGNPQADVTLDLRGLSCPGPLVGAKRLIDDMAPGQVLLLLSDCPGTPDDLFAWVKHTDNHIARTERRPDGSHGFYIRKGRIGEPTANVTLDLRGAVCPGPIVEAKKLLNGMRAGEILKLVSNCPGVGGDVTDWVKATGLHLVASEEVGPGEFQFYIGK